MPGKKKAECVKVIVRARPFAQYEKDRNCKNVLKFNHRSHAISITNPAGGKVKTFTFDAVFDENSTQKGVYTATAVELVDAVIDGYNGTVFAYGQTGCGKTFTMEGVRTDPVLRGIIPNSFEQIFDHIETADESKGTTFLVQAAYLEIYNEMVRDLLSNNMQPLDLKEHKDKGVYVKGLQHNVVKNEDETFVLMEKGNKNRAVSATAMNATSSRSHSIFIVTIETSEPAPPAADGEEPGKPTIRQGCLNLVDLAGSERQSKTKAEGSRLREAKSINMSLSALGNVISALVAGKGKHIPYRDSKLTRLLQNSLGGNAKTVMVAALSPADYNYDETLTTLRYANRAKQIKNKPTVNMDPKDAMLKAYQEQIEQLKAMLASGAGGGDISAMMAKMETGGGGGKSSGENPGGGGGGGGHLADQMNDAKAAWEEEKTKLAQQQEESSNRADILAAQMEEANADRARIEQEKEEITRQIAEEKQALEAELVRKEEESNLKVQEAKEKADLALIEKEKAMAARLREERDRQEQLMQELSEKKNVEADLANAQKNHEALQAKVVEQEKLVARKMKMEAKRQELLAKELEDVNKAFEEKRKRARKKEAKLLRHIEDIKKNEAASKVMQEKMQEEKKKYEQEARDLASQLGEKDKLAEQKIAEIQKANSADKEAMAKRLAALEASLVQGGEKAAELQTAHKKKLRREAKKRQKEIEEKRQLAEQKEEEQNKRIFIEEQYESLQEEVTDTKKKCKLIIEKYNTLQQENDDLEVEFEHQKEGILDDLRESTRKAELYHKILKKVLSPTDLERILMMSNYNEDQQKWKLPNINLPIFFPEVSMAEDDGGARSGRRSGRRSRNGSATSTRGVDNNEINVPGWNMKNSVREQARKQMYADQQRDQHSSSSRGNSRGRPPTNSRSRPASKSRSNSRAALERSNMNLQKDAAYIAQLLAHKEEVDPLLRATPPARTVFSGNMAIETAPGEGDDNLIPNVQLPSRPSFQPAVQGLDGMGQMDQRGQDNVDLLMSNMPDVSRPTFQPMDMSATPSSSYNDTPAYLSFEGNRTGFQNPNDSSSMFLNNKKQPQQSSSEAFLAMDTPIERPAFNGNMQPSSSSGYQDSADALSFEPAFRPSFQTSNPGLASSNSPDLLTSAFAEVSAKPSFNSSMAQLSANEPELNFPSFNAKPAFDGQGFAAPKPRPPSDPYLGPDSGRRSSNSRRMQ